MFLLAERERRGSQGGGGNQQEEGIGGESQAGVRQGWCRRCRKRKRRRRRNSQSQKVEGEEYRKRGRGGGETCTYIYTYVRACFLGMVYCFYIIVVVMQWMEKKRKEQTQNKLANKVTQEKKVDKGELINTSDYWKRYLPVTPHVCPLVEWLVGLLGCLVG